jgi:hypothetical protein
VTLERFDHASRLALRWLAAWVSPVIDVLDRRRGLAIGLSVMAGLMLTAAFAVHLLLIPDTAERLGIDFRQYTAAASRWIDGQSFYQPWQLTGAYNIPRDEYRIPLLPVLYPPYALVLLVPFAILPILTPLYWAIPISTTAIVVWRFQPRPWTWPILTLCVLSYDTIWQTISGNPAIWAMAALAVGTTRAWPAVYVLIKPTLAPFAIFGIWQKSWWVGLASLGLVSLAFAPLWADYTVVLANQRGDGILYSLNNSAIMLIPLVAWAGRSAPAGPRPAESRTGRGDS